ncbi:calponin homology domain-containing protein DDB_G0272472-like [Littorina saxatilis]|uniref:calponin homology domain-containing protein DDB_G0272472-like n=1 Tax=Littorina saxatilis TaxID=31220 RepID=UPI0038B46FB4
MAEHSDTGGSTYDHYLALGEKHALKAEALSKFAQDHMDREERIQEREAKKVAAEVQAKKVEAETKRLEAEAETRRLEAEAEAKKAQAQAEAETKRLEAETRRLEMELDAKRLEADTEARKMDLEFKKAEAQQSTGGNAGGKSGPSIRPQYPKLPMFKEDKDDIDSFLFRFETHAKANKWSDSEIVDQDSRTIVVKVIVAEDKMGVGLCADVSHKKITEEVVLEKVVCGTSRAKAKKKLEDFPVPLKNVVTPDLSVKEEDLKSLLREDETLEEVLSVSREDEKYAVCAEKVVDVEEIEAHEHLSRFHAFRGM